MSRTASCLCIALVLASAASGRAGAASPRNSGTARGAKQQAPNPAVESASKAAPEQAASKEEALSVAPRGPTRIDFDDRLIQGQSNKSGAVYLFDRKELAVRSMVQQRTSFRSQIVRDILTE
jgi:hypothetical protein